VKGKTVAKSVVNAELHRRVMRNWDRFSANGVLSLESELKMCEYIVSEVLADTEWVGRLNAERKAALLTQTRRTIASVARKTHPTARAIGEMHVPLPGLSELETEIYTIPSVGRVRGSYLTYDMLRLVIADYEQEVTERQVKRDRLMVIQTMCEERGLTGMAPIALLYAS
jgi:hypothetical protein